MKVVTYNLLTPHYATPEVFPESKGHLDPSKRFKDITAVLEEHMKDNAIICLQEVCIEWGALLKYFFMVRQYTFFATHYGSPASGRIGVAIAVPIEHSHILCVNSIRVAETVGPSEHAELVRVRPNRLLYVGLVYAGKPVLVGTYHMPCAYDDPALMTIHATLATAALKDVATRENLPCVFAGDFNLLPTDPGYAALTADFTSACVTVNGAEPAYTTQVIIHAEHRFFQATIDYILHRGLTPVAVRTLPAVPEGTSLPSESEPSDHLLLWACFDIE